MAVEAPESVSIVDGHYFFEGRAAAYLVKDGDEAAFVDNITRFSTPYLMKTLDKQGLNPEQVRYIIVTHVHLDHSGGTAELLKHCPNATILCHPKAAPHIVDPTKLIAGAKDVYGDEFEEIYGEIEPVDETRVTIKQDEESVALGNRRLTFYDTPGHARHHHSILDSHTNMMYSGDAFGLCYQTLQHGDRQYMNYVCAPPTFEPQAAIESVRRILATNPDHIGVTHFGMVHDIRLGAEQVIRSIGDFEALAREASQTTLEGVTLLDFCTNGCLHIIHEELRWSGLDVQDEETMKWATNELNVTAQGVGILAQRMRKG